MLPSAGGAVGAATLCSLTELALKLSPRTLAGGGIDLEGGGAAPDALPICALPPTVAAAPADTAEVALHVDATAAVAATAAAPPPTPGPARRGARLLCDVQPGSTSQFCMCDDPHNEYGVPRELGAVLMRGPLLRVIIPRVHVDRTVAQFPVRTPADSLLARYQQGEDLRHMTMLDGTVLLEGRLTLKSHDTGALVLEIVREPEADGTPAYAIKYTAPLSAYQALCVALALCAAPAVDSTGPPVFPCVTVMS